MNKLYSKNACFRGSFVALAAVVLTTSAFVAPACAQGGDSRPALLISSDPLPESLKQQIYTRPVRVREIQPSEVAGQAYYQPVQTPVSARINELGGSLRAIQDRVGGLSSELNAIEKHNQSRASEYYAAVATLNTQLQSGTTPGNPRLVQKLSQAESSLDTLGRSMGQMNELAVNTSSTASEAAVLLEQTRAAYRLSGAVEEDHVQLAQVEDSINSTIILVDRLLNNVSDALTRTSTYLSSERDNLRTLSLAVSNGDLYGKSLGDRPFSTAGAFAPASPDAGAPASAEPASFNGGPRPLVKIKFDRPDVDYEQPVYMAVNEALQRYPNARFDLVAVHPSQGNAAEVAIESTRARRNAERVLRTLTQMGLSLDRVDLSYADSAEAASSEVHLYIR